MQQLQRISPAQYELLNVLSCVDKDEDIAELKNVIVQFLNTRLQKEIDRLWENGVLNEDKVSSWSDEHMRTPYNVLRTVSFPHVEVKRLDEFQRELE